MVPLRVLSGPLSGGGPKMVQKSSSEVQKSSFGSKNHHFSSKMTQKLGHVFEPFLEVTFAPIRYIRDWRQCVQGGQLFSPKIVILRFWSLKPTCVWPKRRNIGFLGPARGPGGVPRGPIPRMGPIGVPQREAKLTSLVNGV